MIVFAAIVPHPPLSIPGIGRKEDFEALSRTMQALDVLREGLEQAKPDVVIVISPHAYMEPYSFTINSAETLTGSLAAFGLDETFSYTNNIEVVDRLSFACMVNELPAHLHPSFLDHGTIIPLYHLLKDISPSVVQLSFSLMSYERHFRYGQIISNVISGEEGKRIAIIASGDLSHRLAPNSPAGYSETAENFDRTIIHYLGTKDIASITGMHEEIAREAAECGARSFMVLLGALQGKKYEFNLLSYESPFGIGYLTARLA
ncbi:MAG TPA: AmmeMemoRadiSam system protein B [Patescibacteria group bacterium]